MPKKEETNQLKLFEPSFPGVITAKDQQDLMTYPFFSLSKRKRTTPIEFDNGRVKITVTGQDLHGIANIYDADILIYVASQIMEARNRGKETSRRIKMSKGDILEFLGKGTGGEQYNRLKESLERLQSTSVSTTIRRENSRYKEEQMFSWIERWRAITNKNGTPIALEFWIDEWVYEGIVEGKVLTIPKQYFRIQSGLERFLFKLCRKVIGTSGEGELQMKLSTVHERTGSRRKPSDFKKMIIKIVDNQSVPDYWIFLAEKQKTKDIYVCAFSRKKYETKHEAYQAISFIAIEKLLRRKKVESILKNSKIN